MIVAATTTWLTTVLRLSDDCGLLLCSLQAHRPVDVPLISLIALQI
jgi:hypothetical protein